MSVIEQRRKHHNWSRVELANKMEVSRQTIHNWETLNRTPSIVDIHRLSKLLKIAPSKIMNDYINKEER